MEILDPIVYLSYEELSAYCTDVKSAIKDEMLSDNELSWIRNIIAMFSLKRSLIKDEIDENIHVGFELELLQKNYRLMSEVLEQLNAMEEEANER